MDINVGDSMQWRGNTFVVLRIDTGPEVPARRKYVMQRQGDGNVFPWSIHDIQCVIKEDPEGYVSAAPAYSGKAELEYLTALNGLE